MNGNTEWFKKVQKNTDTKDKELAKRVEKITDAEGWVDFIVEAIEGIEEMVGDGRGRIKKNKVVELVLQAYKLSGIDIKFLPNFVEYRILEIIVGETVDAAVGWMNENNWQIPMDKMDWLKNLFKYFHLVFGKANTQKKAS